MSSRRHREREIAEVVVRHGFGFLVNLAGSERVLRHEHRPDGSQVSAPQRLRMALEELGPTFMKLGQILSTRADLLPPTYLHELVKLQDAAPQLRPEIVRDLINAELDTTLETAFASFDIEPIAAASIGQAHSAVLPDGTHVVVKVRRPGAAETIELDLEVLRNWATRATRHWDQAAMYDLVGLVDEFAQTLRAELDYLQEGHNAERFALSLAGDADVHIPKVFWEHTTSRVITLERIDGMKITDLPSLEAASIDRHELALRATRLIAKTVFEHGFFHADPHPGNFFVQDDGRIGLIDFGMVGTLSDGMRDQLAKIMVAISRRDPARFADAVISLGTSTQPVDMVKLREDLAKLLNQFEGRTLRDVELGSVISKILDIVRRHHLRLPRDLALLLKAFVMEEGLATQLDPELKLADALKPYAYHHLLATQLSLASLAARLRQFGIDTEELAVDLPGQIHRALDVLATGGVDVHLRAGELQPLADRAERLVNRIAMSVLSAAVIDAVAELAAADRAHMPTARTRRLAWTAGSFVVLARSMMRARHHGLRPITGI
jgi:ubiquinone biosynthesis protein